MTAGKREKEVELSAMMVGRINSNAGAETTLKQVAAPEKHAFSNKLTSSMTD
ncbi:hypothetical protein HY642_00165 [Candidatus Woesearchaeota archaeon]|nr:hypothetical protein [Candidatus Woesearchaeota archaeon]